MIIAFTLHIIDGCKEFILPEVEEVSYQRYLELRELYPCFIYEGFTIKESDLSFDVTYRYTLQGKEGDVPLYHTFTLEKNFTQINCDPKLIENAIFHLGLVESVNYWKAVCSPKLIIKPFQLEKEQRAFWEKLFYHGLGEFLYCNGIYGYIKAEDFVSLECDKAAPVLTGAMACSLKGNLIPVGGGKDSIVSLELLKDHFDQNTVFLLDPRKAAVDSALCAGYTREKSLVCHRVFDPTLFDFNKRGYLNGHIPYSAVLAFCALLTALLAGRRHIILSNEGSANEPTVPDTLVNHQYSKTFEFEKDFSDYVHAFITPSMDYFSLLRPWSEMRITQEFARYSKYHDLFRSCNRGSKENKWCGACPKCLFVFILLASELGVEETSRIFGSRVLENKDLIPVLEELTGVSPVKPFECVGTVSESVHALDVILSRYENPSKAPLLLEHFASIRDRINDAPMVYIDPDAPNLIPEGFRKLVLGE